ncbi:MAG: glycosyltransferase [Candidatus Eremiobacteraeota bacterium]|nr:glycosyltransferase [Candidatus Eremiobacteraeota bacterium]
MQSVRNLHVTFENIRSALQDAVRLRMEGIQFAAHFDLEDPRSAVARKLASSLLQQFPDHDARRVAFTALAQQQLDVRREKQINIRVQDPAIIATMRDIAKLAHDVVVHSVREYEMLCKTLEYRPRAAFCAPTVHPLPLGRAMGGDTVVVWAPQEDSASLGVIGFGLEELRLPVAIVSAQSKDASVLQRAKVIVDASATHCGNALGLSEVGVPLCCASTSGATEYLKGIAPYEPWDAASVYRAVTTALGMDPPQKRQVLWPAASPQALRVQGPLVTIAIRTYNRPQLLTRALQSLASQVYRNLEAVVVNDAGADVSDVVVAFPFARLINLQQNSGGSAGSNVGIDQAKGTYIGFLDDDDVLLPDHLSRLVDALESSGAHAAHTDTLSAFAERDGDEDYRVSGYTIFLDQAVETTDFHVSDTIGPMSVLVRTDVARELGGFDADMPHAHDWEFYLKIARSYDFIHVPYVTGIYSIRDDSTNMMQYRGQAIADAMQRMMQLFPTPGRPLLDQARLDGLKQFKSQGYRVNFPRPPLRL